MRGALVLVAIASCAHAPPPKTPVACGTGWAPLTEQHLIGGAASIAKPPDEQITSVRVDGVSPDLATTLASVLQTKPGMRFGDAPFKDDLRRLWALGVISDAWLEAIGSGVVFVVEPRPHVGAVEIHTTRREDVRRFALLQGAAFEPQRLSRIATVLQDDLVREGHLDARVELAQTRRGDGIDVCVAELPGPKVTVDSVRFVGRTGVPAAALIKAMHGAKSKINHPGGLYDPDAMTTDELYITAEYWEHGYANVRVGSHRVIRKGPRIVIEVPVTEGGVFHLGRIATPWAPHANIGLKRGDVFSRNKIATAREELMEYLGALDVTPETHVDDVHHTLDVTFEPTWRWPWEAFAHWH